MSILVNARAIRFERELVIVFESRIELEASCVCGLKDSSTRAQYGDVLAQMIRRLLGQARGQVVSGLASCHGD